MREMQLNCTRIFIITARRSYASAVLGVVILSVVCPSVCHTRALLLFCQRMLAFLFVFTGSIARSAKRRYISYS